MEIQELNGFGVSESVITKLRELGFETLTQVQEDAVKVGLFQGKSMLINAPTNTGKTFIGELAALNTSKQKEHKRSFFLVPLRALAEEMFQDFVEKYGKWGLKVAVSTSDHYEYDNTLLEFDVVISTYEKLGALLVNSPGIVDDIGLVVVDEIQHVGDEFRGVSLEMLLTRLRITVKNLQLIGLSATVSNADKLAGWLNSDLIQTFKRDVELREGVLYTGSNPIKFRGIDLNHGDFVFREFNSGKTDVEKDLDLNDIQRIIKQSEAEQCLVFVNTQHGAEDTAQNIARGMPEKPELQKLIEEIDSVVESTPSTNRLKKVLLKGVAFHHAGLLTDERRIIETAFRRGLIRTICSTPTLGAGVNTPAKNVIILFHQYSDRTNLLVRAYKNISGRAGRLRKTEEFGRSLLFASNERELEFLWDNYVQAKPEKVISQIGKSLRLDCSILGLISSKICSTKDELMYCMEMTYFGFLLAEESPGDYKDILRKMLDGVASGLLGNGFIAIDKKDGKITVTELGLRCAEELLSPRTVLLFCDAVKANQSKIEATSDYERLIPPFLHLCCCSSDAERLYPTRSKTEIDELLAIWQVDGSSYFYNPPTQDILLTSLRTTRMLLRWIEGISYFDLSPYAPAGVVKRIAGTTQWILKGLARLTEKPLFNFNNDFVDFLYELCERVYLGVPKDALPIMRLRIKGLHRRRSMNLATAGFKNIDNLLAASIDELKKVDDIGETLAIRIKEGAESYIENRTQRQRAMQVTTALKMGKNTTLISCLYDLHGDDFAKHITKLFNEEFKIKAEFIGQDGQHEPDILMHAPDGNIVIESKRKESGLVSALESEEILGKGAKYKPVAHVTVGFPDFVELAKSNAPNSKIRLITGVKVGEMLIRFWKGEITTTDVVKLLKTCGYTYEIGPTYLKP